MSNLLRRTRDLARSKFFAAIRHIAHIDDTRRIVAEAVHLQPPVGCLPELAACQQLGSPYAELRPQ